MRIVVETTRNGEVARSSSQAAIEAKPEDVQHDTKTIAAIVARERFEARERMLKLGPQRKDSYGESNA